MKRRAFSLVEILVAVGIVTGPLLVSIGCLDSNARATKLNASHLGLELLVSDLADQLCTEVADSLADMSKAEGDALVNELFASRLAALDDEALRADLKKEARVLKSLELTTTQVGGSAFPRLYRVQVVARSTLGGVVRALRLVEVPPRVPKTPPPPAP